MRIIKLSAAPDAKFSPASWDTFIAGKRPPQSFSLPTDYQIEGFLLHPILPGFAMEMMRIRRNDVEAVGHLRSSRFKPIAKAARPRFPVNDRGETR